MTLWVQHRLLSVLYVEMSLSWASLYVHVNRSSSFQTAFPWVLLLFSWDKVHVAERGFELVAILLLLSCWNYRYPSLCLFWDRNSLHSSGWLASACRVLRLKACATVSDPLVLFCKASFWLTQIMVVQAPVTLHFDAQIVSGLASGVSFKLVPVFS